MAASTRRAQSNTAGLPTRDVALDLLRGVLDDGRSLTDILDDATGRQGKLAMADRAFGRLIAMTALRRLGEIDAMIDSLLQRPLPRKAHDVQHILRLAAAQIAFLDTARHAVVNCAVEQAKRCPGRFDPLVNAVTRKMAPQPDAVSAPGINLPDWLWDSWVQHYGLEAAAKIAAAHLTEPPLDLTVAAPNDTARWAKSLEGQALVPGTVRLARARNVPTLDGFEEGAWWIQDVAASLPARVLLSSLTEPSAAAVADLCAAPGGKTAQLASAGATVSAVDVDSDRLKRVQENLARLGLDAMLVAADARTWHPPEGALFDAILLDAPCTATGNIRRHPDIPWLKRASDVTQAAKLQDELLAAAWRLLRPGGHLIFAVCSLQPEEGKQRIKAFIDQGEAERAPISKTEIHELCTPDSDGDLQTLPFFGCDCGGMDGFFVSRLRKPG